jgi:negative regulator of sigma E activity
VRIERIAGEMREVLDVLERDFTRFRFELISDWQIVKLAAEWMLLGVLRRHAGDVALYDCA